MKAREIIEELQKFDPEMEVLIPSYEEVDEVEDSTDIRSYNDGRRRCILIL